MRRSGMRSLRATCNKIERFFIEWNTLMVIGNRDHCGLVGGVGFLVTSRSVSCRLSSHVCHPHMLDQTSFPSSRLISRPLSCIPPPRNNQRKFHASQFHPLVAEKSCKSTHGPLDQSTVFNHSKLSNPSSNPTSSIGSYGPPIPFSNPFAFPSPFDDSWLG